MVKQTNGLQLAIDWGC